MWVAGPHAPTACTCSRTFIEAVLVHVPVDIEVLPRREGQLGFWVLVRPVKGVVTSGRSKTRSSYQTALALALPRPPGIGRSRKGLPWSLHLDF